MSSNGLVQRLWNCCNVLRDDGLSYGSTTWSGEADDREELRRELKASDDYELSQASAPGTLVHNAAAPAA
jgi:hypothetical protein